MNLLSVKRDKNINNENLIEKAKLGCIDSKDILFKNNICLVKLLVSKWKKNGSTEDDEELLSIGLLGLTIAFNDFDLSKKIKFSTYASKIIWNEFIRITKSKSMKCRSKYKTVSLEESVQDRGNDDEVSAYHDLLLDEYSTLGFQEIENEIYNRRFELIIKNSKLFNKKERRIMRDYFFKGQSILQIGKKTGVTRQATHQMFRRCLKKIVEDGRMLV